MTVVVRTTPGDTIRGGDIKMTRCHLAPLHGKLAGPEALWQGKAAANSIDVNIGGTVARDSEAQPAPFSRRKGQVHLSHLLCPAPAPPVVVEVMQQHQPQ